MKRPLYRVETLRAAGLEAKWGQTPRGAPILFARWPDAKLAHQREHWWMVDNAMWIRMVADGIVDGFDACTMLGDVFSI